MRKIALLSLLLLLLVNITGCATMNKLMWWKDSSENSQTEVQEKVMEDEPEEIAIQEVVIATYHPRHATKIVNGEPTIIPALESNVAAVKKSIQDRYVSLQGSVYYDGFAKSYVILDNTGVMVIELREDDYAGVAFDKNDVVKITGMLNVDYTAYQHDFIVDYLEVVQAR